MNRWSNRLTTTLVLSSLLAAPLLARAEKTGDPTLDTIEAQIKDWSTQSHQTAGRFSAAKPRNIWEKLSPEEQVQFDQMTAELAKESLAGGGPALEKLESAPDVKDRFDAIQETLCAQSDSLLRERGQTTNARKAKEIGKAINEVTHRVNAIEHRRFSRWE